MRYLEKNNLQETETAPNDWMSKETEYNLISN